MLCQANKLLSAENRSNKRFQQTQAQVDEVNDSSEKKNSKY